MQKTELEVSLRPYDDGSGYRETIRVRWEIDDGGKTYVKHLEIEQGDARLIVTLDEWPGLRDAIDKAIAAVALLDDDAEAA